MHHRVAALVLHVRYAGVDRAEHDGQTVPSCHLAAWVISDDGANDIEESDSPDNIHQQWETVESKRRRRLGKHRGDGSRRAARMKIFSR